MSEEKVKEKPPVPPPKEQAREPTAPKTSQSAFDKVLEQQKILQQSPILQSKVSEQGAAESKVKEIAKWQDQGEDRRKRDDREETGSKDKTKQKEKSSVTITREAVVRGGEKKDSRGFAGGGGRDRGGFGGDSAKRHIVEKKLLDIRGLIDNLGQSQFAGKLSQARTTTLTLKPQELQTLVNQIVQSIKFGKNELGWPELRLILREHIFSGLRLRFTSKHGKVSIQFETTDRRVKDLFTAASEKIQAALEEKGIVVQEIKVD